MTSTKYSISGASRMTGKSRTTITKHIRQGKLSCEIDESGGKTIDGSELARVYGDDFKLDIEEGASVSLSPKARANSGVEQGVQQQLHSVQLQLDMLTKERERERQQFEQQVGHLQEVLKQVQDAHNKALLMLEHRSPGAGEWDKKFQELEEKIANRTQVDASDLKTIKENAKQEVIAEIKSKPWWKVAFGDGAVK